MGKEKKARDKFLTGMDAPEAPSKPKDAMTLFKEDKGHAPREAKTAWQSLKAEEQKFYVDKARALREVYEFELQEYQDSAAYKNYQKAVAKDRPQARGRGGGGGRGAGRG